MDKQIIERNFTYHPPKPGQPETYEEIRAAAKKLALLINDTAPDSREKSLAMTKLEEAVFWTNAAIARTGCLLLMLFSCVSAQGEAFDELTAQRRNFGLPPLTRDAELMEFAQMKAEWQASHHITVQNGHNGHEGPRMPGCSEGTGQLAPHWGWGSCLMRAGGSPRAGAGVALGTDGRRYMVLIIRGVNRREINGHRNLIETAYMTPNLSVTPYVGRVTREPLYTLHTPIHYERTPVVRTLPPPILLAVAWVQVAARSTDRIE